MIEETAYENKAVKKLRKSVELYIFKQKISHREFDRRLGFTYKTTNNFLRERNCLSLKYGLRVIKFLYGKGFEEIEKGE